MTQPASPIEQLFADAWHALAPHLPLAREYVVGKYQLDFAYLPTKLNIELDGREFHTNPQNFTRDRRRDRELQARGWQVRRFSGYEVNHDVIACVREMVALIDLAYQISPERMEAWQRTHPRPARRPPPRSDVHPLRRNADRGTVPLTPTAPPVPMNNGYVMPSAPQQALPPAPAATPVASGTSTGAAQPRRSAAPRADQHSTRRRPASCLEVLGGVPVLLLLLWLGTRAAGLVLFAGWPWAAAPTPAVVTAAGAPGAALANGPATPATVQPSQPVAPPVKRVQSQQLNLRTGPGANQPVVTTLSRGTRVEVLGERRTADGGVWLQIRSGRFEGWANARFLK